MSEQIQYNYYSTVATKIGDNTFIFRGKRNMPNLVLQNGDSYVSAKLIIHSSDGLVEIEHEPITNYNKRVIARFPIPISIDIKIGESKEITLNSIIPKSLRFDTEESNNDNLIYLHPVAASVTTEGFCNNATCDRLQKQITETANKLRIQDNLITSATANIRSLSTNLLSGGGIGGGGGGGGGGDANDGSELVCTPITDSEDNEMTLVGVTMPMSSIDMAKAAENSVYHQAAINVVVFIGGFFILSRLVSFAYTTVASKLQNRVALVGVEFLGLVIMTSIILTIYLAFIKRPPSGIESPTDKKMREDENLRLMYAVIILAILLLLLSYFIYDSRRQLFIDAKAKNDMVEIEKYKSIFGDRDCYTLFTYITYGISGWVVLYKQITTDPPKPPKET
jgi:hypothetical protein